MLFIYCLLIHLNSCEEKKYLKGVWAEVDKVKYTEKNKHNCKLYTIYSSELTSKQCPVSQRSATLSEHQNKTPRSLLLWLILDIVNRKPEAPTLYFTRSCITVTEYFLNTNSCSYSTAETQLSHVSVDLMIHV